jgi:putative PIN family toxin of toxin-antitoxin system
MTRLVNSSRASWRQSGGAPVSNPGVVFDCVVFFQAVAGPPGPAAQLLGLLEEGRFTLYASDHVLAEVGEVLNRPKVRARNPAITDETTAAFLDRLSRLASRVADVPAAFSLPRDSDDEPYVNLALVANAVYLVTRDDGLLDLMNDAVFRADHTQLTSLNPVSFLRLPGRHLEHPEGGGLPPPRCGPH